MWFLIQPSQAFRTELVTLLKNGPGLGTPCLKIPVLVHRLCLAIALSSTGEYIDAVHAEVVKMVRIMAQSENNGMILTQKELQILLFHSWNIVEA